ncbi:Thioredoxin [Candidatus Nitrosocosmicus oleophilus]|uniref:Thioredoxin n=2 Tax=Candidatus Nitrosocosmicus oleophilus TaxID=1353260 RepID=A0A654M537_9ARCH|nr:Thioredoxin [Candidatus Nitrosocosmicus oleophilus]
MIMKNQDNIFSILNISVFFALFFGFITLIVAIESENYQNIFGQPSTNDNFEIPPSEDDQSPLESSQTNIPVDDPDKIRLENMQRENPDNVPNDDSSLPPVNNNNDGMDISKPIKLTELNFDVTSRQYSLLVVNFWAEWCGPCKSLLPKINELATELSGSVVFGKLDVDENPTIANVFEIQSIPTLIIFKDGEAVDSLTGATTKEQIISAISPYL